MLWFVVGFIFSWFGLLMFLMWKDTTPRRARLCLAGFLTCLTIGIIFAIYAFNFRNVY